MDGGGLVEASEGEREPAVSISLPISFPRNPA